MIPWVRARGLSCAVSGFGKKKKEKKEWPASPLVSSAEGRRWVKIMWNNTDHRKLLTQLLQLRKESLKKKSACTGIERMTAIPVQRFYLNWANKPTGSRSLNWLVISQWKDHDEVMNIRKSSNFYRLSFPNCKSCVYNCDDLLSHKTCKVDPGDRVTLPVKFCL